MIQLDTNFLIGLAKRNSEARNHLGRWLRQTSEFSTSSLAWAEFIAGPVTPEQIAKAESFMRGRILPFNRAMAERSAIIFNLTGRKRGTKFDCMIAASAIEEGAELATLNVHDFRPFAAAGLRLAT